MPEKLKGSSPIILPQEQGAEGEEQAAATTTKEEEEERKRKNEKKRTRRERRRASPLGEVTQVAEGLYLSGARAVRPARLTELGITCVVNAAEELPLLPLEGVRVVGARLGDAPARDLAGRLDRASDGIREELLAGGRVLVHCVAGVSRSPALVLAFLVKHRGMSLRQAFLHVRERRPGARPSAAFFSSLIDFEGRLRGSRSVRILRDPGMGIAVPDVCEDEVGILGDARWGPTIGERRNFQRLYA